MSSNSSIGGYFGFEVPVRSQFIHHDALLLNSARNSLRYILEARQTEHIYIPKFTCDVILEPLNSIGIRYSYYSINNSLEIEGTISLKDNELLMYTNYFGIKDEYCKKLSSIYKDKLILDCSQAFYFKDIGFAHAFYSPRKFFGVPDGGCLITKDTIEGDLETDVSYDRFRHLLIRTDLDPESGYEDFRANDKSLNNQPIKKMSKTTEMLLKAQDFTLAREKRLANFKYLNNSIGRSNKLKIDISKVRTPMVYPYFIKEGEDLRRRLIDSKIYIATYWPNVFDWCSKSDAEYELAENIVALPVDQRYGEREMQKILEHING